MKHTILAGITAVAMAVPLVAQAADMPVKAPIYKAAPASAYNWSGCYIGAYAGGAWGGRSTYTDRGSSAVPPVAYNDSLNHAWSYNLRNSVTGGGTIGCNWQAASALVFGLEGEAGYLRLRGSAPDPTGPGLDTVGSTRIGDFDAIVAARVGFAADRVLFYAKGGVSYVRERANVLDACSTGPCGTGLVSATSSSWNANWVAGGGIEYAWTSSWSIKAEYLYLAARRDHLVSGVITAGPGTGVTTSWNEHLRGVNTVKVGLNYHFNTGGPVVAGY